MDSIKLNRLTENHLKNREMSSITGGAGCSCGCQYQNSGGSSSACNADANQKGGITSPADNWTYLWLPDNGWYAWDGNKWVPGSPIC